MMTRSIFFSSMKVRIARTKLGEGGEILLGALISALLLAWLWKSGGKASGRQEQEACEELAVSA